MPAHRSLTLRAVPAAILIAIATDAAVAQPRGDTLATLDSVTQYMAGPLGGGIWPGFSRDTIPVAFVFPTQGTLLVNWPGALPDGFASVSGMRPVYDIFRRPKAAGWRDQQALGAASTGTTLGGRPVAQVVVSTLDPSVLLPTAIHEMFHVFQAASVRPGRRFGRGENAFYVSSYPVFNAENEMMFAREGELLLAALRAQPLAEKRELARQFVAVRRARHRRLDDTFAQFDKASELNEGLAQYAQWRALSLMSRSREIPAAWRSLALKGLTGEDARLANLTSNVSQSFRLRYYATGPAQARLLDVLSGSQQWKHEMMVRNETLQDALARISGLDAAEEKALRLGLLPSDSTRVAGAARTGISRLQALRAAQVDSALARPGILLELSASRLSAKDFGSCSFDPQNLFQVTATMQLHARTWRPCAGAALVAEFNVPAVHDRTAGTIRAVIGTEEEVKITVGGQPVTLSDGQTLSAAKDVKVEAPRASIQSAKANVSRSGRVLRITPLP
jgi:hypothetical protein